MNQLFLLKLIATMLEGNKPTQEKIDCAKSVLEQMIKEYDKQPTTGGLSDLSDEANLAREELIG